MDVLPEVLRVVISEALSSGKKLSWSVWDNGEITSVKLPWNPEVVNTPIQSEIPTQSATLILHLGPRAHIKIKRSSSSWRSNQWLKNFLEKKSSQEGKSTALQLLEELRNLQQLQLVHPNHWHLFSLNPVMIKRMWTGAQKMQVLKEVMSCISQMTLSMKMTTLLIDEVLQGSCNIVYEAKDDTTGVSFEKNGVKEWVSIVVTSYGKELSVKEME